MTCSAAVASYFATSLHNKECAAQSLVKALDTFLQEVQEMRDVIMVPNRLRGVPMPKMVAKDPENGLRHPRVSAATKNGHSIADAMALLPVGPRALLPYGVNGFIATEGYLRNGEKSSNQLQTSDKITWPEDLFRRYRVIQALRKELMTDRRTSSGVCDDDENDDEQTRILVARFRQYLSGLFEILDQLTDMAKHLSKWYQEEVNGDRPS